MGGAIVVKIGIDMSNREEKGKSKIDFPSEYVVLDIETTGHNPNWDEIIEIAAIRVKDNEIIDSFSSLIKPSKKVSSFITELTGIENGMLSNAPKIGEVLPIYLEFLGNSVLVGHNVNFDINFLYDENMVCFDMPIKNDFIDTLRIVRKLYPEFPHHRLSDLVNYFSVKNIRLHRSMADCIATNECYVKMKDEILKRYDNFDSFIMEFKKKRKNYSKYTLDAKLISSEKTEFDEEHPLYKKSCVFTGKLERMPRKDAMQLVVDLGGVCENSVTSKTNFLVMGNNDYCSSIKDGKSNKQKKAENLKLKGNDIEIVAENVFYEYAYID